MTRIRSELTLDYTYDDNLRLLRVGVRPDRVWLFKWDNDVEADIIWADDCRLLRALGGLCGFATAVSQHTEVLTNRHYGNLSKLPEFDVSLNSTFPIPLEIEQLVLHFNKITRVGQIRTHWPVSKTDRKLPDSGHPVLLFSGGKDSVWKLLRCSKSGLSPTLLFVRGATINGEYLNELPFAEHTAAHFGSVLRLIDVSHCDMSWKALTMQQRTQWRDLVLVVLARLYGNPILTGINEDSISASQERDCVAGVLDASEIRHVSFHFHNSAVALGLLAQLMETSIDLIPSEYMVLRDMLLEHGEVLELTHSCQDPLRRCNPLLNWGQSCSKCKTQQIYRKVIYKTQLSSQERAFVAGPTFAGDLVASNLILSIDGESDSATASEEDGELTWDVALSYASEDKAIAGELCKAFRALGLSVFNYADTESLSRSLACDAVDDTYGKYLEESRFVLVLWSHHYRESKFSDLERRLIQRRLLQPELSDSILIVLLDDTWVEGAFELVWSIAYDGYPRTVLLEAICRRIGISPDLELLDTVIHRLPDSGDPVRALENDLDRWHLDLNTRGELIWALLVSNPRALNLCRESLCTYPSPKTIALIKNLLESHQSRLPDTSRNRIVDLVDLAINRCYKLFFDDLIEIPSGMVQMGFPPLWLDAHLSKIPIQHKDEFAERYESLHISKFFIDRFPITRIQAHLLGLDVPRSFPKAPWVNDQSLGDDLPATGMNLQEAKLAAGIIGRRLPTVAEWEKAARGGIYLDSEETIPNPWPVRLYPWIDMIADDQSVDLRYALLNDEENNGRFLEPVYSHSLGKSPYGVEDLCGNSWEWTDSFDGKGLALLKGGSWFSVSDFEYFNRWGGMVCGRGPLNPIHRYGENVGFRTVASHRPNLSEFKAALESGMHQLA